jgi:hypothetical protein
MDNNFLMAIILIGVIGSIIWFYFLEQVIISAMKKYKKWEIEELKKQENKDDDFKPFNL